MTNDNPLYDKLMKDYDHSLTHSGVNGERVARRLYELSQIGFTEVGGVRRPGFSDEEKAAKELVKKWMKSAGLTVTEDGAGNVAGRLDGSNRGGNAIASGSHLDSVPNGGNFDGPLGVLSALEVAESWKDTGYIPLKPYEVHIFSDEEGSRFNSGLIGSRALTGGISEEEMAQLRDFNNETLRDVLNHYGSSLEEFKRAKRNLDLDLFVEVHIEQGKVLERAGQPAGIVSGIAGPAWLEVEFIGEAGHAGNTPMIGRKDPLVAASEFIGRVSQMPKEVSGTAVATVGKLQVSPNGINVIPQSVKLHVDIRDIQEGPRDDLLDNIMEEAKNTGQKHKVAVEMQQNNKIQPVPIHEGLQKDLAASLLKFGIEPVHIPSGAGHDAMMLGRLLPVAMLFVRSAKGISHNPAEWSSLNDCILGVHVLKDFIEQNMQ